MRGALNLDNQSVPLIRIIPADAGSTYLPVQPNIASRDHPRGCGEHPDWVPVVGGKRDHPRGCGEHSIETQ